MDTILSTFQSFFIDEKIAVFCGVIYVILTARNNVLGWVFGIIGSTFWAYGTYVHYNLFFDSILNVLYIIMGFVGLYNWLYGQQGRQRPISELPMQSHIILISSGAFFSFVLAYLVVSYELISLDYPYLDSFTTIFSLIATYILIQRARSNWLYFIIIDSIYVYVYIAKDAYLYAGLFVVYTVIAVIGYINWGRLKNT